MSSRTPALRGKQFFLTYPKCTVTKEYTLQKIVEKWRTTLKYAVVAQELHKDGTDHLHCLIVLTRRTSASFSTLTSLTGKHGDYKPCRRLMDCMRYVTKEGNYIAHGVNVQKFLELAKEKKSTAIAVMCQDPEISLQEINRMAPGFLLMHLKKVQAYMALMKKWQMQVQIRQPGTLSFIPQADNYSALMIADWLTQNVMVTTPRTFKAPQMFLHGPPNMGKTSLINKLIKCGIRIYFMPYEDFYDTYDDDCYDLIVLDEFKGQKKIQDLNQWLDGSQFPVRRKGIAPYIKKKNLPFIIISNYCLDDCYNVKPDRLEPLKERVTEFWVDQFIEINIAVDEDTDDDNDDD